MGVAAYNRGSQLIRRQLEAGRPVEFEVMDRFNLLAKFPDAGTPFGPVIICEGNGGWWIECPQSGFGYWYKTFEETVRRWQVNITGKNPVGWIAEPKTQGFDEFYRRHYNA